MSIIGLKNIPVKVSLPQLVKTISRPIRGQFEALGFRPAKKGFKIGFVKLSERLDPLQVMQAIKESTRFVAFMPSHVPDLPPVSKKVKTQVNHIIKAHPELSQAQTFVLTHFEIMAELESKYTGLYNLSKKTGHKLLDSIARTIFERLTPIAKDDPKTLESGFKFSKAYRAKFPHFGDFQLILSTLHRLQDAAGAPRTQLSEAELTAVTAQPIMVDNVPLDKVKAACNKYSDRIIKKILEHVGTYQTDIYAEDNEEQIAKKRVQDEIKKVSQYLPEIIKQVIYNHLIPQKMPYHRIRVYGEPYLPSVNSPDIMAFGRRHRAVKVMRSDRMFNMMKLNVPVAQYNAIIAEDGVVMADAKLVVRSSERPTYKVPRDLVVEMKATFGEKHEGTDQVYDEELDIYDDESQE